MERPKVLYNEKTRLYVMWFHLELKGQGYSAARAGVATSKSPMGPFAFLRDFRPDGEMSRDMTLFEDSDGKAYLITTSENNQTQHVSQLTDDYLDTTGHYTRILAHRALEGEAIFKINGHYFYIGSHTTGGRPILPSQPLPINSPVHGRSLAIRAAAPMPSSPLARRAPTFFPCSWQARQLSSSSPTNGGRRTPSMAAMCGFPSTLPATPSRSPGEQLGPQRLWLKSSGVSSEEHALIQNPYTISVFRESDRTRRQGCKPSSIRPSHRNGEEGAVT